MAYRCLDHPCCPYAWSTARGPVVPNGGAVAFGVAGRKPNIDSNVNIEFSIAVYAADHDHLCALVVVDDAAHGPALTGGAVLRSARALMLQVPPVAARSIASVAPWPTPESSRKIIKDIAAYYYLGHACAHRCG